MAKEKYILKKKKNAKIIYLFRPLGLRYTALAIAPSIT